MGYLIHVFENYFLFLCILRTLKIMFYAFLITQKLGTKQIFSVVSVFSEQITVLSNKNQRAFKLFIYCIGASIYV